MNFRSDRTYAETRINLLFLVLGTGILTALFVLGGWYTVLAIAWLTCGLLAVLLCHRAGIKNWDWFEWLELFVGGAAGLLATLVVMLSLHHKRQSA